MFRVISVIRAFSRLKTFANENLRERPDWHNLTGDQPPDFLLSTLNTLNSMNIVEKHRGFCVQGNFRCSGVALNSDLAGLTEKPRQQIFPTAKAECFQPGRGPLICQPDVSKDLAPAKHGATEKPTFHTNWLLTYETHVSYSLRS
jgi:hypothetical protein